MVSFIAGIVLFLHKLATNLCNPAFCHNRGDVSFRDLVR